MEEDSMHVLVLMGVIVTFFLMLIMGVMSMRVVCMMVVSMGVVSVGVMIMLSMRVGARSLTMAM